MNLDESWQVQGAAGVKLSEGTEDEVKLYLEEQYPQQDLSIVSPEGKEYILEGGKWVEV